MIDLSDKVLILGKEKPYNGREDDLQIAVVNQLFYGYRKYIWFHVPNGGKRNAREAARFKRMGVMAGVADIIVQEPKGGYPGLNIELKNKGGRLSEKQIEYLNKATERGYLCAVVYSFDACMKLIKDYLNGVYQARPAQVP